MKIKGFTIKPADPSACARLWRFYGTRETVKGDDGRERPHPNRWELVREVRAETEGEYYTLPDFDLPRTEPGRWRFYNPVMVDAEGRETWHADNEIVLPRAAANALGGDVDIARLLLYNLELKGSIAPGQLHD
jgi:hypothetical protein